jgi:hypothetical protein
MADIIVVFAIFILYGIAKFCTDLRRDLNTLNKIYHWAQKKPARMRWYQGTADNGYTQRFPWTSDFWHTFDSVKMYLIIFCILYPFTFSWELVAFIIPAMWVSGRVFALGYHYVLPDTPKGTLWMWVVKSFLFWQAENI